MVPLNYQHISIHSIFLSLFQSSSIMKFQLCTLVLVTLVSSSLTQELAPINPEWTKQYDLTKVPDISTKKVGSGTCPNARCDGNDCETCWESCGNCARPADLYGCQAHKWALSFDDGPSEHTSELLDILAAAKVKATFLMVGSQVVQFPDMVKRAHQEGHLIAQHTWSHPHLMSISNEQIIAEVRATEEAILNVTGVRPAYIRSPYGEADDRVKGVLTAMGYHHLLWNMDTLDWDIVDKHENPEKILDSFQTALDKGTEMNAHNDPGFISLQHDLYVETVKQVPSIEKLLAAHGFHFVLANECIGAPMYKSDITNSTTTPDTATTNTVSTASSTLASTSNVSSATTSVSLSSSSATVPGKSTAASPSSSKMHSSISPTLAVAASDSTQVGATSLQLMAGMLLGFGYFGRN
ncbi:chitin deacetylase [Basidiobolus ranarum]|uniref:Chitin deacetylase n=1 Tax=Basidiobolus ranarum TaxID=34480 RepID=A0ABR2VX83_9FUNG